MSIDGHGYIAAWAPAVRVERGHPDDVELAALVAGIVAARSTAAPDEDPGRTSRSVWTDHARRLGQAPPPGPDSWRWSLTP